MAGNRTRINCLEGNYAHHYTTIAARTWRLVQKRQVAATFTFSVLECYVAIVSDQWAGLRQLTFVSTQ